MTGGEQAKVKTDWVGAVYDAHKALSDEASVSPTRISKYSSASTVVLFLHESGGEAVRKVVEVV